MQLPPMPMKQKMATGLKSLFQGARSKLTGEEGRGSGPPPMGELFTKVDPAVDGDDCLHDCDSCTVRYPRGFKIDEEDLLYGHVKGWSTHVLVGTGKADWVRDVADEKGSVMEAIDRADAPTNGVSPPLTFLLSCAFRHHVACCLCLGVSRG